MARRLVKIAKELNVGTATIVEHLHKAGFEIDNKPTSKVSDEMYDQLLKQFSNSIAEKEKADKLVIGTRIKPEDEKPKLFSKPPVSTPKVEEPVAKKEEPVVEEKEVPVVEPEVVEDVKEEVKTPAEAEVESNRPHQLKVIGKIDLDAQKKPKPKAEEPVVKKEEPEVKKEEPVAEKKEEPTVVKEEKPVVKEKVEETSKTSDEAVKPAPAEENKLIRANAPTLKGPKILGKIDAAKLKEMNRPKKKDTDDKKGQSANSTDANKRKRKRKKVPAKNFQSQGSGSGSNSGGSNNRGGNRNSNSNRSGGSKGKREDEIKEVSQKEIEDKIKATMARLSNRGKNKRQKIRRDNREDKREKQEVKDLEGVTEKIQLTEFISVSEFANLMDVGVTDVITTCMNLGVIVSINQRLDAEIIELLADEFNKEIEFISAVEEDDDFEEVADDPADLVPRAPIVTVMGHVDHGKTSLLDFIRNASVADGEAGGITQHIGAYEVRVGEGRDKVTFLDTPGHEAFTAMRARGAKVTDVSVIIIAADDNIMPQTKEAISHSQAAGVPMIFAINKIDKPGASPDRIKQELSGMNLLVEEWGGKYQSQDISAKTGLNIDKLLEKIVLESELLELKANPNREAVGTVIEASLDKGRGYVTKILVQNGTLEIGDPIVSGEHSGKVKAMFNEKGKRVKKAGPSQPVLVLGLSGAPQAGEKFKVADSEQEARQIASRRGQIKREQTNRASKRISLDEIGRRLALGTFKELNLIIKGDVDGSIEALADSLQKQSIETVQVNIIHKGVGQIIESDVLLASASDAIIIGFQVRPSMGARNLAEKEGVEIKTYSVIYEAIDTIRAAIEGMLEPTQEEKITGQVDVRETYKISKIGTIAGCIVQDGSISRNSKIRIIRNGIVVYPTKPGTVGEISSLKRFKDDVKEVKKGLECGITIKNYNDIKEGDTIEVYEIVEIRQTLD
ncbi:translation initiation factor IF-2 [Portibacter lacus]|uniref:Translation initiation factor IF-2 n=1 Tax=Portibacter lacus TaxID=1099794 RepID=A0AA37SRL0_9BACT|nr:translation initiation factor IF-2 [Portibacter lacus]GLR18962.1 translation initiation factor IF-2 [Portibacter lacus]